MVYPPATERFGGEHSDVYNIGADNEIPDLAQARRDLDTEVSVRAAADTALQAEIDTEITDRTNADAALDSRLDTVEAFDARFQYAALAAAGQQLTSNSTTYQNVSGIKVTGIANGFYWFHLTLGLLSTVTADAKFQFTVPAGAALAFSTSQYLSGGTPTLSTGGVPAATTVNVDGSGSNVWIEITGSVFFGANAGDCQLQAAQQTATVETTDFVVGGTNIWAFKVN